MSATPNRVPCDLVIRGLSVLTENGIEPAAVAVAAGVIVAVGAFDAEFDAATEIRLELDQVLIPGIVDTHVHVNEPGRTDWEGFASATRAAAAGGVTTIIDMPLNSIPPTTTPEALELKRASAASQAAVNVGFWGGAIPENLGTLRSLHNAGVFGFKAFLSPSGVDEFPHLSLDQLTAAGREIAAFGGRLIVHAEDPGVLLDQPVTGGPGYGEFVASRPELAEQTAIANVIDVVRSTGVRAHILHLSSASALPMLRAAKAEGLPITVETCPHYLSFAAESIPDGATEYKCCPPIRDEANRDLLWAALLEGVIDFIASDHSPSTRELKLGPTPGEPGHRTGDFGLAWGGISGLQLSLPAVWTAARARGIGLEQVIQWMSSATARFAGLAAKGRIAVGADADLVAFAPAAAFIARAEALEHKNKVSAFDGAALFGRVDTTWLAGVPVDIAEHAPPRGALLVHAPIPEPVS
jgi:allantoinase